MNQLLGVLLGGALTLTASFGAVTLQARHQRKESRAKELRDRRTTLYLDLLTELGGHISFAADFDEFLVFYGPSTAEHFQLRKELNARVALFASPETRDLWKKAADAALVLHANTIEGGHFEWHVDRMIVHESSTDPVQQQRIDAERSGYGGVLGPILRRLALAPPQTDTSRGDFNWLRHSPGGRLGTGATAGRPRTPEWSHTKPPWGGAKNSAPASGARVRNSSRACARNWEWTATSHRETALLRRHLIW